MPADDRKVAKLESRPIQPISMPEYRYQDYVMTEHYASMETFPKDAKDQTVDLRGVCLNLG